MAKSSPRLSSQILEEASSWFIDFNDRKVDAGGREEFNAWLRRSPEHVQAYLQISAFWEDTNVLKNKHDDIEALIARSKEEHNVFPLELSRPISDEGAPQQASSGRSPRGKFVRLKLPFALTASVLIAGLPSAWIYNQRNTYTTDIGEQRSLILEDGSSVELNSRSRLKVHFTEGERKVELLAGQALFRVARNPGRPFIVAIGDAHVRAVGTQFDVYKKRADTVVTVVEGKVAIGNGAAKPEGPILLAAGEQLTLSPAVPAKPKRTNVAVAIAWTEKKLVFESAPLREVVEEFNRYNRLQLVIRDPNLYDFHVSGVFPSTDSRRMVEFLRHRFGVTMNRSGDQIEIFAYGDSSRAPESQDTGTANTGSPAPVTPSQP